MSSVCVATRVFRSAVQDMNTRLISANLDFDSRLQHVSFCVPDECSDSREFRVDPVFLRFGSEPRSHVWLGCDDLTRTPVFRVTVVILMDPAETLVSLVSSLFWSTALESDQHARASEWS